MSFFSSFKAWFKKLFFWSKISSDTKLLSKVLLIVGFLTTIFFFKETFFGTSNVPAFVFNQDNIEIRIIKNIKIKEKHFSFIPIYMKSPWYYVTYFKRK